MTAAGTSFTHGSPKWKVCSLSWSSDKWLWKTWQQARRAVYMQSMLESPNSAPWDSKSPRLVRFLSPAAPLRLWMSCFTVYFHCLVVESVEHDTLLLFVGPRFAGMEGVFFNVLRCQLDIVLQSVKTVKPTHDSPTKKGTYKWSLLINSWIATAMAGPTRR